MKKNKLNFLNNKKFKVYQEKISETKWKEHFVRETIYYLTKIFIYSDDKTYGKKTSSIFIIILFL